MRRRLKRETKEEMRGEKKGKKGRKEERKEQKGQLKGLLRFSGTRGLREGYRYRDNEEGRIGRRMVEHFASSGVSEIFLL